MDYTIQVRENRLIILNEHSFVSAELIFEKDDEKAEFLKEYLKSQLSE